MSINNFVLINDLRPGDVIKASKFKGIFDHYIVYLGFTGIEHKFVANMQDRGVDWLEAKELTQLSKVYEPTEIRRFVGSEFERNQAIVRAIQSMKKSAYNLLTNNCEHLANYVQNGVAFSRQSKIAGFAVAGAGLGITMTAKSDAGRFFGIFTMIAGGLIALSEDED